MSRGPVPSQLHLLSDLPAVPVGNKVRFLGCVTSYSTSSARLTLGHLYPKDSTVTASVDVSLLLQSLTNEKTRVGEYVNVIGYVTEQKTIRHKKPPYQESKQVGVQAIVLWSTGPMDLQKYEKLLSPHNGP
ncbi:unnamed protein product [Fusarium graminearum]|uniref:Chromosome 1, complete genome n=2 Tax=Gibberella zeae TaxID=5518 RepID=A0A1C3YJK0_GIBZE|nr:unnamed protein product [Fusarium graminearum]CAG1998494.1 unnamed protein product [Fusarium graminearum]SCB64570.1 unnamed protein product [Fusarium graminearum]